MATSLSGVWSAVNVSGQTMYQSGTTYVGQPAAFAANATIDVTNGATVSALSGASLSVNVQAGGVVTSATLTSGTVKVADGGTLSANTLDGVCITLSSGAQSLGDTFLAAGAVRPVIYALDGAMVSGATIGSGGILQMQTGVIQSNITTINGGSTILAPEMATRLRSIDGASVQSDAPSVAVGPATRDTFATPTVLNGVWSAVNINGQTVYQNATSTVTGPVTLNAATLYVKSGAIVTGLGCVSNTIPTISVYAGGSITDSHITRTYVRVDSGATLNNNQFDGCDVTLSTGARSTDDTYSWYGFAVQSVKVASGAVITHATVTNKTTISAATGATIDGLYVGSGGSAVIASGVNLSSYSADSGTYLATYTSIGGSVTIPGTPVTPAGTVL